MLRRAVRLDRMSLGFSDQAHFQREFKKLVNATPLDYLNRVKYETYLKRIQYL